MIRLCPNMLDVANKLDAFFGVRLLALDGLAEFLLHRTDKVDPLASIAILGPEAGVRAAIKHLIEKNPKSTVDGVNGCIVDERGQKTLYANRFENLGATLGLDVLAGLLYAPPEKKTLELNVSVNGGMPIVFKHEWADSDAETVKRHAEKVTNGRPGLYTIRDTRTGPIRLEWSKAGPVEPPPPPKPPEPVFFHAKITGQPSSTVTVPPGTGDVQVFIAHALGARRGDVVSYQRVGGAVGSAFVYNGYPRYRARWSGTSQIATFYAAPYATDADLYRAAEKVLTETVPTHRGDRTILVSPPDGDHAGWLIREGGA